VVTLVDDRVAEHCLHPLEPLQLRILQNLLRHVKVPLKSEVLAPQEEIFRLIERKCRPKSRLI
jgi:hypothetical protein